MKLAEAGLTSWENVMFASSDQSASPEASAAISVAFQAEVVSNQ